MPRPRPLSAARRGDEARQQTIQRARRIVRHTAVERARQALLAATTALDEVRGKGFQADDLAVRLARLGPELTKLNEGAGRHGVQETIHRAVGVQRDAEALRSEAEQLPQRAEEIDRRLVSLRTRA